MLRLAFSNRLELLIDGLIDRLAQPSDDPFVAAQVVVPSAAVRRAVQLAVADRLGVCANLRFAFLGQWLWQQIGRVVPVQESSPFEPALLAWRIYGLLDDRGFVDAHPRLAAYLRGADPAMRLELAGQLATLFDHYITYRPAWLAAWSAGRPAALPDAGERLRADEAWQAELWRRISRALGAHGQHPARGFVDALAQMPQLPPGLPAEVHLLALPSVPPLYLDVLRGMARRIDVCLHVLNPCQEYWFDLVDRKRLAALACANRVGHHETLHPLLAGWGRQTQAQIPMLLADDTAAIEEGTRYAGAGHDGLLGQLQDSILDLTPLEPGSLVLRPGDRSLEVHVCHGLTREIEVLHDQLLAMFAADPSLRPADILVVTPDLEAAAPLVDAVFGTAPAVRRIPYGITGLAQRQVNPVARVLDALLSLMGSRLPASAVFALLEQPPVARRFALPADDLDRIRDWIHASGIRWGADAAQRQELALPASDRHTFDDGLQRLYLGYALGDAAHDVPLGTRLAAGSAEGQAALALGRFWRFASRLARLRQDWSAARDADGWRDVLLQALDDFVAPVPEWVDDLRTVRAAIAVLHGQMTRGGLTATVPLAVVHAALGALVDEASRGGVPGGAVTFAAMPSLRGLPYRVVWALGLSDGAYPGGEHPLEFDLMAAAPQAGDRQRRQDERNLFLDLLLAARERFVVSYAGRDIRDNSHKPPSVLVSELLDTVADACLPAGADAAQRSQWRAALVVEHPLQPFSQRYFGGDAQADPRLASHHEEYCEALRARQRALAAAARPPHGGDAVASDADAVQRAATDAGDAAPAGDDADADDDHALQAAAAARSGAPFFAAPLPPAPDDWHTPTLDQLLRFFANPCRVLLQDRLQIRIGTPDDALLDDEPFLLERQARSALAERLLPALLADPGAGVALRGLAQAGTELPAGRFGEHLLDAELAQLSDFATRLRAAAPGPSLAPAHGTLEATFDGERWTLQLVLAGLHADGLVRQRYEDSNARDFISGWIEHLALCALRPAGVAPVTRWVSRDGSFVLRPVQDAQAQLRTLLSLYRQGLRAPLHFFPRSAWAWAIGGFDVSEARKTWRRAHGSWGGESTDAAFALALRGVPDPIDARFVAAASAVLVPLLQHLDDPRLVLPAPVRAGAGA